MGHATDRGRMTGCTVVLPEAGVTCGIDPRGQATSLRQVDSLFPTHLGNEVHAIYLTGGSAFGLDSAAGVMAWLEERDVGLQVPFGRVPVVPTAAIFDLSLGDHRARPDAAMAGAACRAASGEETGEGAVGAGTGATVGKLYGIDQAMKGGLGGASRVYPDGLVVAALAVVNAYGDVRDPDTGRILAGAREPGEGGGFADTALVLASRGYQPGSAFNNTVLVVLGTNARLSKPDACRLAQMSQAGLARAVRPCHSVFDGDVVFAFSTGAHECDLLTLAAASAELVARAIVRAVTEADGGGLIPAWKDLQ